MTIPNNKLIGMLTGMLLALVSSMPAMAADKAPVAKTLFTNVNVFDGKNENHTKDLGFQRIPCQIKQLSPRLEQFQI